jgi:hypothetical protein
VPIPARFAGDMKLVDGFWPRSLNPERGIFFARTPGRAYKAGLSVRQKDGGGEQG